MVKRVLILATLAVSLGTFVPAVQGKPGGHGNDGRENCPHAREGGGGITGDPEGREERASCVTVLLKPGQFAPWMVDHCIRVLLDGR